MNIMEKAGQALNFLRKERPLIHHITNFVTMTDCANATLAIGASPTMTNAVQEVEEMAAASRALVLNMGTLQQWTVEAMHVAGKSAAAKGIPIILDPVGVGGTRFRTESVLQLLQDIPVTVIRGNLSEITCLVTRQSGINLGVDNHAAGKVNTDFMIHAANVLGTTVVITGPVDAVSNGKQTIFLGNGCPMLTYVTGTGCMTTSLIASFAAVASPFIAAVAGVSSMGIAGELAFAHAGSAGPGTFHQLLIDQLYQLTETAFTTYGKVLTNDAKTN